MKFEVSYDTVTMVHDSWDRVKAIPNVTQVAGELLFRNIFKLAPGAWALFPFGKGFDAIHDDMFTSKDFQRHAKNVVGMLDTAVHFLGPDLAELKIALIDLGARHVGYGVLPEHYPIVGQALLETLATALGEETWTDELKEAWTGVYGFVTKNMLQGANESLLRLSFAVLGDDQKMSLDEYVSSMLPHQKELYFVTTTSEDAEVAPQVQQLQNAGVTILEIPAKKAELMVTNLEKYLGRKMIHLNALTDGNNLNLDFLAATKPRSSMPRRASPHCVSQVPDNNNIGQLTPQQADDFCTWFQTTLGDDKVVDCTPTCTYASLPARVVAHQDGKELEESLQRLEDFDCMPLAKKHVQVNPAHEFILEIYKVRSVDASLAAMMAEQVLDNCLVQAGLMDDCRGMVQRMTTISMCLLKLKNGGNGGE